MKIMLAIGFLFLASQGYAQVEGGPEMHTITERIWHLGNDSLPEWTEGPTDPEGAIASVTFQAKAFAGEGILFLEQRDIHGTWVLQLNGKTLGNLEISPNELTEYYFAIPEGLIVDGDNELGLVGLNPGDDILFGNLRYMEQSVREHFQLRPFAVHVTSLADGVQKDMPARITVVDSTGQPAKMYYAEADHVALRPGVLYTGTGHAVAEMPMGNYTVYASRGMEWSRAKVGLTLGESDSKESLRTLKLELIHEVRTPGFVAADTHIHTLTHSGHGDSSMEERQITLAGEGVELAIATDHNHNTDYRPLQKELGLTPYYTAIVGNEVTTPIGHFNAFPLDPDEAVPPYKSHDLAELLSGMRAKGARTVILNHPRWPEGDKAPFATIGLDSRTGFWAGDWASGYDAMELVNSDTREENPMQLYRDWFALMNRGESVVAVGSSDSHEVGVVVGQGRTYVRSSEADVSKLDENECSDNIAKGHSSVAMGIFMDMQQHEKSVMGEHLGANLAQPLPEGLRVRIAAPSWVQPERLTLFANGQQVITMPLGAPGMGSTGPFDSHIELSPGMKLPSHDYWLVAVVRGAKVTEPFWPLKNDYTLGSTNPIYVDVDGDGKFSSAFAIAQMGLKGSGTDSASVLDLLAEVDGAVAAQVMRLVRLEYLKQAQERIEALEKDALKASPNLKLWIGEAR
ncbi:MAG: CehA/McbA family metallohydrolase [Planctomycetota bacterium]|nr:CehA/McbA family metallohydrolase [Planctomycetota bacterium]